MFYIEQNVNPLCDNFTHEGVSAAIQWVKHLNNKYVIGTYCAGNGTFCPVILNSSLTGPGDTQALRVQAPRVYQANQEFMYI